MRILVTAFEPYGGNDTNISQKVLDAIQADVAKLLLPVSFRRAPEILNEAIGQFQPDVIISMGQAAEGDKIRLERLAINLMDSAKGDNDGYIPDEELICPEAPLALKTALPLKSLCADCINAGLPTMVSNSAGLYVCNRIYFEALRRTPDSLFVHIPKNMDLEIAQKVMAALTAAVTALASCITDDIQNVSKDQLRKIFGEFEEKALDSVTGIIKGANKFIN